jgi:hypothetical protein
MVPSIAQVVFATSPKALSEPHLATLWLECGALARISMRLTCATWCCWAKDLIQEETSHATWSRCASVWNIFVCFSKYSLLWDSPLSFILEGGHVSLFSMLFDWNTFFSMLLEHILSFFSMIPLSFLQEYKKRNLFGLWSIYIWWMDDMFCVTHGVGVSMYMLVYVISIMGAWKDSTKGHKNLAKLKSKHM